MIGDKSAMMNNPPMTVLAQLNDVTVFQTLASQTAACAATVVESRSQPVLQKPVLQNRQANYGALNLGLHVNDDAAQVLNNRMRLLTAINSQLATAQQSPIKSLHWVNQVHGKQIYDVDTTTLGMRPLDADALVSQQAELGLAIMTADCVPIVLYQPATGQIAAIHAGWQGLACGVITATAARFDNSAPIMAWIGVCISQANYEVGYQVRDQLLAGCMQNQLLTASAMNDFQQRYVLAADTQTHFDSRINANVKHTHLYKTVDNLSIFATVTPNKAVST
jgi:YfiH family protein